MAEFFYYTKRLCLIICSVKAKKHKEVEPRKSPLTKLSCTSFQKIETPCSKKKYVFFRIANGSRVFRDGSFFFQHPVYCQSAFHQKLISLIKVITLQIEIKSSTNKNNFSKISNIASANPKFSHKKKNYFKPYK
uniref:Uncharacterized protein n=1 Tax=Cacopsylla melanoneura TaxID=428564 RepID=A0A8D8PMY1_9HEMI